MALALTRKQLAKKYEPAADYGFFGPDSVTWKVWSYPTSFILGFVRSVTIEHLDPNLAAAVIQSGGVKYRPNTRYTRTLRYFGMVMFGASEPTARAADVLVKVHSKAIGNDPVTHGTYDANKPSSQLWIHVTAWHSILMCYELFGPGRLSEAEEEQYWAECARAAELQTIDPATVPRSRDEVRQYFDDWRPHLASSEGAQDMVRFILKLDVALPPSMPRLLKLMIWPLLAVLRRGVISTYPQHMRDLFGIRQGRVMDALVRWPLKISHGIIARSTLLTYALGSWLAPAAFETLAPVVLGVKPLNEITMTPREAQAKYGFDTPSKAHAGIRARQQDRVFGAGEKPSDEGLIESEEHIGPMDPRDLVKSA
jgi:uncharacterized protein (DUF2236 family)